VARLVTRRVVYRLLDPDGQLLAEVADDTVAATDFSSGAPERGGSVTATHWREVEVEAGPAGDETLLATVGTLLTDAGAAASKSLSKLSRALGPAAQRPPIDADSTLADLVSQYVSTQCEAIVAGDLGLRLGHDVIHPTRVAIRRLRSTLRTFSKIIDPGEAASLERELVWFAGLLGEVRDSDVLRLRLSGLVADLPDELVLGPVTSRIDNQLAGERAEHWRELVAALDTPRLIALLETLERWRLAPPFTPRAEVPAATVAKYLRRSRKRLRRRLASVVSASKGQQERVHSARKAGKRFRYAAELAEPTLGGKATAQVDKAEALQDLLGEHQDSVVSVEALRRFGAVAGTAAGENGFTFGVLLEAELRRGAEIRSQIAQYNGGKSLKIPH
jgi:CHAD domain-containing protein